MSMVYDKKLCSLFFFGYGHKQGEKSLQVEDIHRKELMGMTYICREKLSTHHATCSRYQAREHRWDRGTESKSFFDDSIEKWKLRNFFARDF